MWPLALALAEIALHRRGPDQLPASRFLFGMLWALDVAIGLSFLWTLGMLSGANAAILLVDSIFFLAFVLVTLRLFHHERRFQQTASALLGTDILFNVIGWPLALWGEALDAAPDTLTAPTLLRFLLLIWWVDVSGFIVSRALARPYFVGVLIVILYVVASLSIRDLLAPAAT